MRVKGRTLSPAELILKKERYAVKRQVYNTKYYQRCTDFIKEGSKRYYDENKDMCAEKRKAYYYEHREDILAKSQQARDELKLAKKTAKIEAAKEV